MLGAMRASAMFVLCLHGAVVAQLDWAATGGRSGHAAAPLGNGIMLAGGANSNEVVLSDAWEMTGGAWSPLAGSSTQLPPLYGHAMSGGSNGRVVVFGGSSAVRTPVVSADTWVWTGNNWTLIGPPLGLAPRWFSAMAFDSPRNEIVMFGGADGALVMGDTWILDMAPQPPVWRQHFGAAPPARYGHAMAYDAARQRIVLTAGASAFSSGGSMIEDHWEWNGTAWSSVQRTNPAKAWRPAMAYDAARQRIVLTGGFDRPHQSGGSPIASTFVWDGTTWSTNRNWDFPDPRGGSAVAFNATRQAMVLQGGAPRLDGRNARTDTWQFDGTGWTQLTGNIHPLERQGHAMCFDPVRRHTVMFGGDGPLGELQDTWTWDGQSWLSHSPPVSPVARWRSAMAFDETRGVAVLFGGLSGSTYLSDLWMWSGGAWQQASPPMPRPSLRAGHAMAFDSVRQEVVLFGGEYGTTQRQDTWVWNGTTWSSRSSTSTPVVRRDHAMAFDAARGRVVMHGGWNATSSTLGDTWEMR